MLNYMQKNMYMYIYIMDGCLQSLGCSKALLACSGKLATMLFVDSRATALPRRVYLKFSLGLARPFLLNVNR